MGTAQKRKRVRRKVGDILRIELGAGLHAYAQVADEPVIVFFEGVFEDEVAIERIPDLPVLFRLGVANHAISSGLWQVTGLKPLTAENALEPFFYKQDAISGRLSLYHSDFAATGYERPATLAECQHLECAAVWEPEHVVDRLRDHASGTPNRWLDSLKINAALVPA